MKGRKYKEIPLDWWEKLEKVQHNFVRRTVREQDENDGRPTTRYICTDCGAYKRSWGVTYLSCQILTTTPHDDSPCMCTRRLYLEAHGII